MKQKEIRKGQVIKMDNFEKVEKLREHANVSYEEAKAALENSEWNILDAMIYLEKQGKIKEAQSASFNTEFDKTCFEKKVSLEKERTSNFNDSMKRFGRWLEELLEKGNRNSFCVDRFNRELIKLPVTALVILLFFAFPVIVPLLIVGLFFDMHYHFAGPDVRKVDIDLNKAMDTASAAAENIKTEINNAVSKEQ